MDPEAAAELARQCLPALQAKCASGVGAVASAQCRHVQGVWTGEGGIVEITMRGEDDAMASIIAKSIGTYKNCDDMDLQDHWSYYNEVCFYETDLPDRMWAAGVRCPRPLLVQRRPSASVAGHGAGGAQGSARTQQLLRRLRVKSDDGEELDEAVICMTKLAGGRWSPSRSEEALSWLARLHALFWGAARADAAVAAGVLDQTGFWHLDNRPIELGRMGPGPLRLAAAGVDARLKADRMQTLCHGDPKGANIIWDEDEGVSMYDFQWFGKGPPTKDLAYFFATAALNGRRWDRTKEESHLRFYHVQLCDLLTAQGDVPPSFEHLHDSYRLACLDYRRWQEGGFSWGNVALLDGNTDYIMNVLCAGASPPKSEEEYRDRIFECFPP